MYAQHNVYTRRENTSIKRITKNNELLETNGLVSTIELDICL